MKKLGRGYGEAGEGAKITKSGDRQVLDFCRTRTRTACRSLMNGVAYSAVLYVLDSATV